MRARYGLVLEDGRVTVEHALPRIGQRLRELPEHRWPAPYRLRCYGVEPTDAVLLGMGRGQAHGGASRSARTAGSSSAPTPRGGSRGGRPGASSGSG